MDLLKTIIFGFLILSLAFTSAYAASPQVRLKDIAHILEARENQLMGFGLVVGLKNSGDSQQTGFTKQALTNLLSKMGITPQIDFKSRNAAAVMVTCNLPAFVKSGQKIDVTVSSVGDASSLQGGTLLLTPLQGADGEIYAVAQGSVSTGTEQLAPNLPPLRQYRATVGRIPGGALVEKEVPVSLGEKDLLTIVLDEPDFTTANRVAEAILDLGLSSRAQDAGSIIVAVESGEDMVKIISRLENILIRPDSVAKVVINERTGTIVVGDNVKLSEAAVSFGDITVTIGDVQLYSQGTSGSDNLGEVSSTLRSQTTAKINSGNAGRLTRLPSSSSLGALVRALNAIHATPKDLIAILQALKKSGALKAELEII